MAGEGDSNGARRPRVQAGAAGERPSRIASRGYAEAVAAHRASDYFKSLGRKMGEFMAGPPEVLRLTEVE